MPAERIISIMQKGLFVKSAFLSALVLGIVLAKPVTGTVVAGVHKVCQFAMKSAVPCEKAC